MSPEQLTQAFSRAELEQTFWPPVAVLRGLAGVPTVDELERQKALEALDWVLVYLRLHGVEHRTRTGMTLTTGPTILPPPDPPEDVRRTCQQIGLGVAQDGLLLMAKHPRLAIRREFDNPRYENVGKQLWAEKDLEKGWVDAYRKANGGQ